MNKELANPLNVYSGIDRKWNARKCQYYHGSLDWDCEFNSPDYWHFPKEVSIFIGVNTKNQGIFSQYTDGILF